MQPVRLIFALLMLGLLGIVAPDDARAACGGDGELVCITSGCDSGHRQYLTKCWKVESEGFPSYCGGTGEPACSIAQQLAWNLGKACKSGRREYLFTCYAVESEGFPSFCGGTNEPACTLDLQVAWGLGKPCKSGRVEDPGIPVGTCRAIDADGWPSTCGGENEDACEVDIIASLLATTGKVIGACKDDLIQQGSPFGATCVGPDGDGFPPFCGDIGERACLLTEHVPSCKRGAIEEFGIPYGECKADQAFLGMTDFTRPNPMSWAPEELPPGPRTVIYIHGKGGHIADDTNNVLLSALAEAGHTVYGADYNAGAQRSGGKFQMRKLRQEEDGSWIFGPGQDRGGLALDGTNFYLQQVAEWIATSIVEMELGPNVAVLAGSMGGLVARHLVYRHYDELRVAGHRITEVVTFGSPHTGGGFGIPGVTGPAGVPGYVVQEDFGCAGRFLPIDDQEERHRYQVCLIERWQAGRASVDVPIDDSDYPQIYWATLAGTGELLTVDRADEFTPLDGDGTVALRSALGIAQDDCFPHDTAAGPRVEETTRSLGGESAWSAQCHHPEYAGMQDIAYLYTETLDGTGHDFSVDVEVGSSGEKIVDVVTDYVTFNLTAAADTDLDGVHDDWQRYFAAAPDNCRLTPNASQADTNANGWGDACDADYDGDGVVGIPDFQLLMQVYGAQLGGEGYSALYDANGDGEIGAADFALLLRSIGRPPGE